LFCISDNKVRLF